MTRYEFLKSAGFSGAALMAILTSCVREEDKFIDAISLAPNANTIDPPTTTGTVIPPTTPVPIVGVVTTEELNKITATKLKIDLSNATYAKLKTVGGYVIASNIVVALSKANTYIAATVTCSHEPKKQIIYNNNEWYCTAHDARFSLTGAGLNSNGKKGLTVYKVATDGKTLVVY